MSSIGGGDDQHILVTFLIWGGGDDFKIYCLAEFLDLGMSKLMFFLLLSSKFL